MTMKISIVVPTYNRARLLPRAVESILSQSYGDWELIVVDDGSTDNTAKVMEQFVSPKVSYLKLEKNGGVSAARNRGVEASTGDWVSFLDSDDAYLPGALATLAEEAAKAPASTGMLFFLTELYAEDGSHLGTGGYAPARAWDYYAPSYEDLLLKRGIKNDMHRTYRTSVMRRYPFDEGIKDHDTILYAVMAKRGVQCLYVNKSLVKVYVGRADRLSQSKRDPRAWQYIFSLYFRDHDAALRTDPPRYSSMAIGMASCCFKLGEPLRAVYWLWRGFVMSPISFFKNLARNFYSSSAEKRF